MDASRHAPPVDASHGPVILFDGICNLCNGLVQFVLARDSQGIFRFASLQSESARALLGEHPLAKDVARGELETLAVVRGAQVLTHSDAALAIARALPWPWRAATALAIFPKGFRDAIYRFVARHRYRIFGRSETCWLPSPQVRARFLP